MICRKMSLSMAASLSAIHQTPYGPSITRRISRPAARSSSMIPLPAPLLASALRCYENNVDEPAASRITRYRETAATLRRQAGQLRSDQAGIKQLLSLADGWDQLAARVEKERFW